MFITNKYHKWYFNIIDSAKNRNWTRRSASVYTEQHHVIPKSIDPSKAKDKENLVLLTAKEHFICHLLLTKFTSGQDNIKMKFAFHCMLTRKTDSMHRYRPTSRFYEIAKKYKSLIMKQQPGSNLGKKLSDETKHKMSLAKLGRKFTDAHKAKMLEAQKANRHPKPSCCIKCRREFTYNPTKHFNLCHRESISV